MTQQKYENNSQGLLEGLVDGVLLRHFWSRNTQESQKSLAYLVGNTLAVEINPAAIGGLVYDLVTGNYR